MSHNTRLGVCIPTYRRPEMLYACGLSVIEAAQEFQIPIFITDDSGDDTNRLVLDSLRRRYEHVFPIRNEKNLGIDRNILKAIDQCRCDFAWPIGEDDRMLPDGVRRVWETLGRRPAPSFVYVNYASVNQDFSRIWKERSLPINDDGVMGAEEFFRQGAWSIGFMGACVINKRLWREVPTGPYLDTYFAHVGVILESIRGREVHLVASPLVWNRSGTARVFTWAASTFEVIHGWTRAMEALVHVYGAEACQDAIAAFERAHGIDTFRFLLYARGEGIYDRATFRTYVRGTNRSRVYKAMAWFISWLPPFLPRWARWVIAKGKASRATGLSGG